MKPGLLIILFISFFCASAQKKQPGFYKNAPKKFTPVNDFAGLLSATEKAALSKKLVSYKDSTGNVFVIITQQNLMDPATKEVYEIEEAALHYFNKWGIGDKQENNGVLIFVAKEDRKVRITTGKGIDALMGDDVCQLIVDQSIVPNFKIKQYAEGLNAAADAVIESLSPSETSVGEQPASQPVITSYNYVTNDVISDRTSGTFGLFAIIGVMATIAILIIRNLGSSNADVYTGAEPFIGGRERGWFGWFGSGYHHHNHYNNFNSSNNSSSSSFDSSSASSDSSSSSSFGGGSSDGGGASGSW